MLGGEGVYLKGCRTECYSIPYNILCVKFRAFVANSSNVWSYLVIVAVLFIFLAHFSRTTTIMNNTASKHLQSRQK